MNFSGKGLELITSNLNLINLPSSLWGIHIHPEKEYIAVLHVNFISNSILIDKGIIIEFDNVSNKVRASIYLNCKNVTIPQVNPVISSINDLCQIIFYLHGLKFCDYWQSDLKNENCLIYVEPGYQKCLMCNNDDKEKYINYEFEENNKWKRADDKLCNENQLGHGESVWQPVEPEDHLNESLHENLIGSSEDVDVVVKQILELEYTGRDSQGVLKDDKEYSEKPEMNKSELSNECQINSSLQCKLCSKLLSSISELQEHEQTHSPENKFICSICDKRYASSEALNSHLNLHARENIHQCEICTKEFTSTSHLKVHLRKHSGDRPFACEYCERKFFTKGHLKEHIRLHTGERPYKCHICSKTNTHKSAHQRHLMSHSNAKPNLCNICGKTFAIGYRMEDHMITHSSERPFSCDSCDKSFAKASRLKIHQKIHTGIRSYVCSDCGKSYTTQSNLRTHMKSHTGEKPHVCGACGKCFVHPRLLRIHQRMHTGEKPYSCEICDRAFAKNVHLTVHRRTHTGERPYACDLCHKTFTTSGNLKVHMRIHRQDTAPNHTTATG